MTATGEQTRTGGTCLVEGVCEVTLETSDRSELEAFYTSVLGLRVLSREDDRTWLACGSRARLGQGPVEHPGGDRSLYCEDPAGNVLELWDFFERDKGRDSVEALASSGGWTDA